MTNQTIETVTASQPASPTIDGPKAKGIRQVLRTLRLILKPTKYMDDSVRRYGYMFHIGSESASPLVYVGEPAGG